ncbi:MAG: hypothetical protein IPN90_13375 [Elusimicrobia bacterium]|nr:hypothetical protein [Elusimicrobiota bacterium]
MTETETRNVYAVVRGQAVVLMSVTESWSAGSDGRRIEDITAHGYSHSVTTVVNQYNVDGQLIGARLDGDAVDAGDVSVCGRLAERCWAGKKWWWC